MERSKQNKHVVGKKDNSVDDNVGNGVDNGVDDSDDDSDDDSNYGVTKHLTHLSQAVDCCLMERSKHNKHVVGKKDNGVDDSSGNSVGNSVDDNVDNSVDDSVDGADKHLAHISQA
eukprot:14622907-Ditylum_brightwellii.AAC.1